MSRHAQADASSTPPLSTADRTAVVRLLGAWYDRHRRDLPWRRTRDPYAIWVSEVMLQQTRVDTVIPYYQRFLERFPDVRALAAAPLESVLSAWSGLGYYRRARQLSLAAGEVVERYGGAMPTSAAALRELSGVGRYTAAAIASIAYDEAAALVDGNVIRVLSRLFAVEGDMRSTSAQRRIWALAEQLVPQSRPGRFNQALMELGATVCTPSAPRCAECPLALRCRALATGCAHALPQLSAKKAPRPLTLVALVAQHAKSGRVLLGKRENEGLYGGLWEPPQVAALDVAAAKPSLIRHGLSSRAKLWPVGRVEHVLSHRRLAIEVVSARASRAWRVPQEVPPPYVELQWCVPKLVPLSALSKKLLARAGVEAGEP